jgi:DNA-binding HxlR family transcriptional regulator
MERKSFAGMDCSVAQCLEVIGEWWTMLIVRDAFLGVTRFDVFQERLGIARNVLQLRLERLVDAGVFERVAYSEHPPRYDYLLTPKGRDLWPVVNAMRQWGDQYAAPSGPPIQLVHRSCGHETVGTIVCSECGGSMDARNVQAVAGEGRAKLRRKSDFNRPKNKVNAD